MFITRSEAIIIITRQFVNWKTFHVNVIKSGNKICTLSANSHSDRIRFYMLELNCWLWTWSFRHDIFYYSLLRTYSWHWCKHRLLHISFTVFQSVQRKKYNAHSDMEFHSKYSDLSDIQANLKVIHIVVTLYKRTQTYLALKLGIVTNYRDGWKVLTGLKLV